MNRNYIIVGLLGIIVGACATMAADDGALAIADQSPDIKALAESVSAIELQNATLSADVQIMLDRFEALEAELDERLVELEHRSPGLGAYDAQGNWLGVVMEYSRNAAGSIENLVLHRPGWDREFSTDLHDVLHFESDNCTGQAYILDAGKGRLGVFRDGKLYAPSNSASAEFTVGSAWVQSDGCNQPPTSDKLTGRPAVELTPPFPVPVVGPVQVR